MPVTRHATVLLALLALMTVACRGARDAEVRRGAKEFLDRYTARYVELYTASNEAEWASNTKIVEGDDTNRQRTQAANEALAAFTGSEEAIETARRLLERRQALEPLQVRQLERVLFLAADKPATVPELVKERIAAEAKQTEDLFGFDFTLHGRSVTTNEIDRLLAETTDLGERLAVWEASKEVGKQLRDGLTKLVSLRNRTVQALGYTDYFAYQVSEYGMTTDEMMELNRRLVRELWPLYRELHTWARYTLAERYGADEVPELLPAHWLPNRWGQEWTPLVTVEGLDLDSSLATHDAEWVVRQAEQFYVSLGLPELPATFWERSSLYPLAADAPYKKNNHASAWHIDLDHDVRSLMSVEPREEWWMTTHHELGHVYYFLAYSRPEVPPLLRRGANRAFHEAVGSLLGMASMQRAFLEDRGLVTAGGDGDDQDNQIEALLKEALDSVVFIPWSAGVMTEFEHDLYAVPLPQQRYNASWWEYKRQLQGIVPPSERGEGYCDPATKTHINDDAAQYYDYALSYAILHQLHAHIARTILDQDPHNTDYYGNAEVGSFLEGILELGATRDWREVMREALGEEISAQAMLDYFAPLLEWLKKQNAGRTYTLPETPEL